MPPSLAPECLSSTFVLEWPHYAILCSIINSRGMVLFGGIGFFLFPNTSLFFPLFTVLPWRWMKLWVRSVVIWFCPVLITDCWGILPFLLSFCQILSLSTRRQFHFSENNFTVVSQIKAPLLSIRGNHSRKTDDLEPGLVSNGTSETVTSFVWPKHGSRRRSRTPL